MSNLTLINVCIVLSIISCVVVAEQSDVRADRPDFCYLPPTSPAEKKCKGYFKKWTYNATQDACVSYIYGGCHGTKNLFETEEECQVACLPSSQKMSPLSKKHGGMANSSSPLSYPSAHQHYLLAAISCFVFLHFMRRYRA